ncbi:MAG: flagellar biosynthesis protein FlhA [Rhizobiaceae bacterium]|nr:flagellar biosynthesis protein FlhA [Rhizobiaceae bacterium]
MPDLYRGFELSNQQQAIAPMPELNSKRDVAFAIGVLFILAVLFMPIPPWLIDIGLALSIGFSVLILMVALWIEKPLDFSSFPTVLLIATMLRLSLNISTTRLILSNGADGPGAAGDVIGGFANFVMGGDFFIGVIVFVILIIVNFMVITKGASRIAEVGARFTLDAIPGKQMAIDADLSAGLLDDKQAQARRKELEEESSFFGSMDGASKFVRGDAIAGLIITAVNVVGGIIIGVTRHGMEVGEAADVFTQLSVGDGLVSQIPALIVSLAAGLLVSKGGTRGATEKAVLDQLAYYPRALMVSAGLMFLLAFTPGLPFFPFATLAALMLITAYFIPKKRAEREQMKNDYEAHQAEQQVREKSDSIKDTLKVAEVELVLGKQLASKLLVSQGEMGLRVSRMRKKFAKSYGFVIPEIKVSDDLSINPRCYEIRVFGTCMASEEVSLTDVLVIANDGPPPPMPYDEVKEPAFGAKAWQVSDVYIPELKQGGYRTIDTMSLILTHVSEVVRNNLSQLFSYKDIKQLIDGLEKEYASLVEEISPAHLSISGLQAVFKLLLAERVSVRNVSLLLEAVAEIAPHVKRTEQIVEHVRMRISQQICGDIADHGVLKILRLGNKWDGAFGTALQKDARGEIVEFNMQPSELEAFGNQAKTAIQSHIDKGEQFAITTSPETRTYVRMIIERLFPTLPVLSHVEIARGMEVQTIGTIAE